MAKQTSTGVYRLRSRNEPYVGEIWMTVMALLASFRF